MVMIENEWYQINNIKDMSDVIKMKLGDDAYNKFNELIYEKEQEMNEYKDELLKSIDNFSIISDNLYDAIDNYKKIIKENE